MICLKIKAKTLTKLGLIDSLELRIFSKCIKELMMLITRLIVSGGLELQITIII